MKEEAALKPLYIIGAGGMGRETAWLVERINQKKLVWALAGFIDDDVSLWGTSLGGCPVLGGCGYLAGLTDGYYVLCAVGSAHVRRSIVEKVENFPGLHFAVAIDPDIVLSPRVSVGEGTIICTGSSLTVDIQIGRHNIISPTCTVGHDAVLGDFVTLYPGVNVSGNVCVGDGAELGTGCQVIQGKQIGSGTVIGAGAVVVRNIGNNVTAVGIPARVVSTNTRE